MGLFLMVLGFMWWWPLGLIILAVLIANGRSGYRRRLQFAGSGPMGDWDDIPIDSLQRQKERTSPRQFGPIRDEPENLCLRKAAWWCCCCR